ncbi:MAG TPA: hypothetical protein VLZ05_01520 [Mycobacterium sp.]|nr:hypothetical protein [Mycobacterium sp.]HUH67656.1 hypothetical protein [Mycobacterium sp.]
MRTEHTAGASVFGAVPHAVINRVGTRFATPGLTLPENSSSGRQRWARLGFLLAA